MQPGRSAGRRALPLVAPLPRVPLAAAAVALLLAAVLLLTPLATTRRGVVLDDLGELAVAVAAAVATGVRARRAPVDERRSWAWLCVACSAWATGQAVWSWYEVVRAAEVPSLSVADLGFLAFPVATCVALVVHPATGSARGRTRRVLDALMATVSLALVAWETAVGAVLRSGADSTASLAVSLAYPVMDVAVLLLTVLTLSRSRAGRTPLALVALGLVALAGSDSAFAYLSATSSYTGGLVDLGWFVGFVLIALAATAPPAADTGPAVAAADEATGYLPYLPVLLALGATLVVQLCGSPVPTGQLLLAATVVVLLLTRQYLALRENSELTRRLAAREAQLHHQAFHDGLTGLANRALFQDRLEHALELHARDLRPMSVLFLDLDDFKVVNDTLGHASGDELLRRVADRVLGAVRAGDTVARLGGDEFAVLLEDGAEPTVVAEKVLASLARPVLLGSEPLQVRASVGVFALEAADARLPAGELLAHVDTAMYCAKRAGKGRLAVYRPGMALEEHADRELTEALRAAVSDGGVHLEYQPVVDLRSGAVRGLEALARWEHAGRPVPPDVFVPLAQRCGLLPELTEAVLDQAFAQLVVWSRTPGLQDAWLAVNVSAAQLAAPSFAPSVLARLARTGTAADRLVVELTESDTFVDRQVGRDAVARLRRIGVGVSLDDFGTGYASLAQLSSLPIDAVKVDRSFIAQLEVDARQAAFLPALLHLAHDLGVEIVVEGIERPAQLAELQRLGYPLGQGYLLHRPLAPERVVELFGQAAAVAR